ncbi:peptidase M15 [Rhodobacteraceae bacterium WD3A24]|nr:peptidase M15 [Rhodobacteraceae bacterium WD3A24]
MMTRLYEHYSEVPDADWWWQDFSPAEIACCGTGKLLVHEEALDTLQALRDRLGKPLIVTSGYRSPEHNRAVGGATRSKHMEGTAFDISMTNQEPHTFEREARAVGFKGFGTYPRSNFMHIDLGPERSWGAPWPAADSAPFSTERPPARERLAESRTMRGAGAAGAATLGTGAVEVAQESISEAQGQLQALVPYLDSLRWVLIALALGGVVLAVYARLDDWKRGRR